MGSPPPRSSTFPHPISLEHYRDHPGIPFTRRTTGCRGTGSLPPTSYHRPLPHSTTGVESQSPRAAHAMIARPPLKLIRRRASGSALVNISIGGPPPRFTQDARTHVTLHILDRLHNRRFQLIRPHLLPYLRALHEVHIIVSTDSETMHPISNSDELSVEPAVRVPRCTRDFVF